MCSISTSDNPAAFISSKYRAGGRRGKSLPNKIGYLLGLSSKKLEAIIYYERYVVIQAGIADKMDVEELSHLEFLNEEEYLDILDTLTKEN